MGGTSGRLCTVAERHAASGSLMPVTPRPWSAWICTRGCCDPTRSAYTSVPFSKEKITLIKRAIFCSGYHGGLFPVRGAVEDRCLSGDGCARNEGSVGFL